MTFLNRTIKLLYQLAYTVEELRQVASIFRCNATEFENFSKLAIRTSTVVVKGHDVGYVEPFRLSAISVSILVLIEDINLETFVMENTSTTPRSKLDKERRKTLSILKSAELVDLIRAEYINSGQDDGPFALYATEKLGVTVNAAHIRTRRIALDIEANNTQQPGLASRVVALEAKVKHLEQIVSTLTSSL